MIIVKGGVLVYDHTWSTILYRYMPVPVIEIRDTGAPMFSAIFYIIGVIVVSRLLITSRTAAWVKDCCMGSPH